MNNEMMRREMKEAIDAGLFSTMIKRSKIDDASRLMEAAKSDLKRFQRELKRKM